MASLGVVARTAVGVVLLAAGIAKLASRSWVPAVRAYGLPRVFVPVLPWVEVVLGALVVAEVGGPLVEAAALALLLAFTVGVARKVAAGDAPPCGCFGEVSTRPATWLTVARNAVLCSLAALGFAAADPTVVPLAAGAVLGAAIVSAERVPVRPHPAPGRSDE